MADPDPAAFPPTLRFGVATAAYQVEGAVREDGRGESIWDRFCRRPGAVAHGHTGDVACDHYHRWREDLDLMADLGIESYHFSISWSRVQPSGRGAANEHGIAFYRRLVEGLLERGIEPFPTLYHWDLPQALQDTGGWAARATAQRFADYARLVAERLGDVVDQWTTHNEPYVVAFLGYALGTKAPGLRDWPTALRASHHLLLSHGLAVQALRATAALTPTVGIALNLFPTLPASDDPADHDAARRMDGHVNRWFMDPIMLGRYPQDMIEAHDELSGPLAWDWIEDGDLAVIAQPLDYIGVNYYCPHRCAAAGPDQPLALRLVPGPPPRTAMGNAIQPDGLHEMLLRLRRDYAVPRFYVTENGAAFDDPAPVDGRVADPERTAYLRSHLAALARAIADGIDVRRYCAWSLLDNFEWEHGYDKRFGLVHVDFETLERVPKDSALWYRDFIARVRTTA
jgi:beta-glucosidase